MGAAELGRELGDAGGPLIIGAVATTLTTGSPLSPDHRHPLPRHHRAHHHHHPTQRMNTVTMRLPGPRPGMTRLAFSATLGKPLLVVAAAGCREFP